MLCVIIHSAFCPFSCSILMRSLGGFFIRRRLDNGGHQKDILYRAILNTVSSSKGASVKTISPSLISIKIQSLSGHPSTVGCTFIACVSPFVSPWYWYTQHGWLDVNYQDAYCSVCSGEDVEQRNSVMDRASYFTEGSQMMVFCVNLTFFSKMDAFLVHLSIILDGPFRSPPPPLGNVDIVV